MYIRIQNLVATIHGIHCSQKYSSMHKREVNDTGFFFLFQEPNPEDPLNKEAAEVLQNNRRLFEQNVQKAMRGGYVGSVYFERCLK